MKGVILAGGKGTRLLPATKVTNKHMIPILNHPMIEYPIQTLKALGITDILLVTGGNHVGHFAEYLGDGSDHGVSLTFRVQKEAGGIAQALDLARGFSNGEKLAVILGDNIFDNDALAAAVKDAADNDDGSALVVASSVQHPERFGVLKLSTDMRVEEIFEKPKRPPSEWAVTGFYIYPPDVFEITRTLKPSARGELEITSVNNAYLERGLLHTVFYKGFWSDAGTPESLAEVTRWVLEHRL